MSLRELATRAGTTERTIRFYIARGLVPGPAKAGRGACYGPGHLERLREVTRLQSEGLTLAEITRKLSGERAFASEPVGWWHYALADDVVVMVRADASPWRLRQIRQQLGPLAANLGGEKREP